MPDPVFAKNKRKQTIQRKTRKKRYRKENGKRRNLKDEEKKIQQRKYERKSLKRQGKCRTYSKEKGEKTLKKPITNGRKRVTDTSIHPVPKHKNRLD